MQKNLFSKNTHTSIYGGISKFWVEIIALTMAESMPKARVEIFKTP